MKAERFHALDGLRGAGALIVFLFHINMLPRFLAPHGWVLIDIFFVLSGFVLAHAYEHRFGEPGAFSGFMRERIIRLHPLLLLSILPGAILIMGPGYAGRDPYPLLTVLSAAIPFPALWKAPLPVMAFPLNMPSWTLFWEILINIIYVLIALRVNLRALCWIVAISGVAVTVTGIFEPIHNNVVGAGLRAFYAFPLGVLLFRVRNMAFVDKIPFIERIGQFGIPILVVVALAPAPFADAYLALVRFVITPLLILGCTRYAVRYPALHNFSGEISYPLYILHLPMLMPIQLALGAVGVTYSQWMAVPLVLLFSWVAWRFYDVPVRRILRRRFGWRRPQPPQAP